MSWLFTNKTRFLFLVMGDMLLAALAFYAGFIIRLGGNELIESFIANDFMILKLVLFVCVLLFSSFFTELYYGDNIEGKKVILIRITCATLLSFFLLSSLYYLIPSCEVGRGILVLSLTVFFICQGMWHFAYKMCLNISSFAKRVLILGTGPVAERIGRLIDSVNPNYIFSGYIHCASEPITVPAYHVVGNSNTFVETVRKQRAQKIVVSLSERRGIMPLRDVMDFKLSGIEVFDAPSFYEKVTGKLLIENITPSSFIFSEGFNVTYGKKILKRIFDSIISVAGLIIALPLIPIVVLLIKADSPGPVFFRQVRVGEKEKNFTLYKFRTMRQDAESKTGAVWAKENDPRVTKIGKFLRKTRLDEIPQLYNVLKGDMSFVGPRPERPEFVIKLKEKIPYYSERHFVKPGVTGWAQIKYPYGASVEDAVEKLRYDLFYIKHLSFIFDLLIVLDTVKVVIFGRGSR